MLAEGEILGAHRIVELLGAGAMGEVYRARDSQLGREVAIKVLPEALARDPERFPRFRREAKLLATLNHPNIAAIYGLDEFLGRPYLVLELVPGESLEERLKRGPIPVNEAIRIATQIADGLDEAHEHGIVHRDLKPANIQITTLGRVKILDFGLAKAYSPEPSGSTPVPTTGSATQSGIIVGTPGYMSPEQACGQAMDKRTDIWAFGVVLLEMLSGRHPFLGATPGETLAAVLMREPNWNALPPETPPLLRQLIASCLVRDMSKRLRDIGEASAALHELPAPTGPGVMTAPASVATAPVKARRWTPALGWLVSGLLLAGLLIAAKGRLMPEGTAKRPARVRADLGVAAVLNITHGPGALLSPDGSAMAFTARASPGAPTRLYVRPLDAAEPTLLAGTEGAESPFFSPDGEWIAFFSEGKLKKIPVNGGTPSTLADAPNPRGGSWSEDGTITFMPTYVIGAPLMRVSSAGGEAAPLPGLPENERARRWPQMLAGGRAVLYTSHHSPSGFEDAEIVVQSLENGERRVIKEGGYHGAYLRSGHIVYISRGALFAVPFDLDRLKVTGPHTPVVEGVSANPDNAGAQFSFSASGTLLYVPGKGLSVEAPIDWIDARGKASPLRTTPSDWSSIHISPDGQRLAMQVFDGKQWDIWSYEWASDTLARMTFDPGDDEAPTWTPDGRRVAFGSSRAEPQTHNIYWQRADGTGEATRLTTSPRRQTPASWHPSGRVLAFIEDNPKTSWDIMTLRIEGDETSGFRPGKPEVFVNSPSLEYEPVFSPDGKWIAYFSNEGGTYQVYVKPFPGPGGRWQVSTNGGVYPVWSKARNELLFSATSDMQIMAAPYAVSGDSFRAEKPRPWSEMRIHGRRVNRHYDLHPDGLRIAAARADQEQMGARDVVLIVNFFDELKRLARGNGR